jgi:hypothetical protein
MAQATVDSNTRRRDFIALTAAIATAALTRPALASPQGDTDPVFGIIAAHAKSVEQVKTAIEHGIAAKDDLVGEGEFNDLCDTEMRLFQELLEVLPTTLAGVVALVAHLNQVCEQDPWKFEDNYATPLIGTLAQAFQRMGHLATASA